MNRRSNDNSLDPEARTREFEKEILAQIRLTVFAIQSAIRQYVGMSQARGILFHCMRLDQEMSQAAIQQRLGVDRSEVTRIAKQMEAEGLITRRPDPSDNRYTLVQLTEAGCALQEEIIAKIQKADATLLQGLRQDDMLCTVRTLTRIRENAERLLSDVAARDNPAQ
jgi:DNA-binding MarR family transcriptional regulator